MIFRTYLCNQLQKSFYNFYHEHSILNYIILLRVLVSLLLSPLQEGNSCRQTKEILFAINNYTPLNKEKVTFQFQLNEAKLKTSDN